MTSNSTESHWSTSTLLPPPDIVVEVDASDFGLCALDVSERFALTYQFSPAETALISDFKSGSSNGFDINFRELLSCAFAVNEWGKRWSSKSSHGRRPVHVHFQIDNTSAVAWQNKLSSRNPRAQVIIRLLSWWETSLPLRYSASNVSGVNNSRADAGSRLSANPSFETLFALLTSGWTQASPKLDVQGLINIWQLRTGAEQVVYLGFAERGTSLDTQVQHISDFVLHGFRFPDRGGVRSDTISVVFDTSSLRLRCPS
ncbi:hypothetical protein PHMEG_00021593 [Phytophthora megakarya]|uniref:Uncharacterized protein n=1 Tax=Phytophthora megakarya TaxID=4795 RepID=A0A225VN51_9STRA|nr:hypothetical protein PHMEG_00021593 [Phytophthora megakarya]